MKNILLILILLASITAQAQFPSIDSLRKFNNKYIRNSAIDAFTNMRANTINNGILNFLDSAYSASPASKLDSVILKLGDILWSYKNGVLIRRDTIKGGGTLDSLRLFDRIKIKRGTDTVTILKADSLRAGVLDTFNFRKLKKLEPVASEVELRTIGIDRINTQTNYTFIKNKLFNEFYWDSTSTLADDTVTVLKVYGITTGRFIRYIGSYINVKWFGAVGDGSTDDYVAIQKAVNFIIKNSYAPRELHFPPGTYNHSQPIICANLDPVTHLYGQATILLTGNSVATNFASITTSFRSTYKNAPNIIFQLCKGGGTDGIAFTGQYTAPGGSDSTFYNSTLDTYFDATVRDSRYSPECAIAVDPFSYNGVPADGGYPTLTSWYTNVGQIGSGSTGLSFKHGQMYNHNIGIIFSSNGMTQNAENMFMDDWFMTSIRIGIVSTQSEEKNNIFQHIRAWSNVHTVILNTRYGGLGQAGELTMDDIQMAGKVNSFIDFSVGGASPSFFKNIYSESLGRIGNLTSGGVAVHVQDFYFGLALPSEQLGTMRPYHINATPEVLFDNGTIRMYGTGLPIILKNSPNFKHTTFEAVPVIEADYTYQGISSPSFEDCFFTAYSTNANSYLGSNKTILGNAGGFNKVSSYGNFKFKSTVNDLYGFAREYNVKGDIIRKTLNPETAKAITISSGRIFTFTPTVRGQFQIKEPILFYEYPSGHTSYAGIVTDTSSNTITVSYVPNYIPNGTYTPMLSLPQTLYGFMGNTTAGSPYIKKVVVGDLGISVGQQIYSTILGGYAVVKKITNDTVVVSVAAVNTANGEVFQSQEAKKIFKTFGNGNTQVVIPGTTTFAVGDEIWDGGAAREIKYICKRPGYLSIDSTPHALFAITDSLMVYDPPDGDSTLKQPSTAWVKRNIPAGGSVPVATPLVLGKVQIGSRINVASGLISADTTWALPLLLPANKTVDIGGYTMQIQSSSLPLRIDNLEMGGSGSSTNMFFRPLHSTTYRMGIGAGVDGSTGWFINHPYSTAGHNGSTPGIIIYEDGRGGGIDPLRIFTADAAGTVYNALNITATGITTFYTPPIFNAHPTYTSNLQVADKKLVEDSAAANRLISFVKNATRDSIILTIGSVRAAVKDSIGSGTNPAAQINDSLNALRATLIFDAVHNKTTTDAVATTIDTLPLAANQQITYDLTFHAYNNTLTTNDRLQIKRTVGISWSDGTVYVDWNDVKGTDHGISTMSGCAVSFVVSGTLVLVQVTGLASTSIPWTVSRSQMLVSNLTAH